MGKARILGNIGTNAGNLATTATGIDVTGTVSADVVSSTTLTSDVITADQFNSNEALPTIKPSLLLDFANSKTLDPRITFTRGSTATYWDGHTTVKAEENLIPQSNFSSGWAAEGKSTINLNNATAPDGTTTAAKLNQVATQNAAFYYDYVPITNTGKLTGSLYLKQGTQKYAYIQLISGSTSHRQSVLWDLNTGTQVSSNTNGSPTGVSHSITSTGDGWYRCTVTMDQQSSGDGYLLVGMAQSASPSWDGSSVAPITGDASQNIYIWGPQLEQRGSATAYTATTSSPVVKYQPVLQTASPNGARFDHDPVTGESKGLLIEEARTNLRSNSQSFTSFNGSIISNNITAPDGTETGTTFLESDGTTTYQRMNDSVAVSSGSIYTWSIYAKSGHRHYLTMDSGPLLIYNLSTGAVSGSTGVASISNYGMQDVGNGWWRCWYTYTTSSTGLALYIGTLNESSTSGYYQGTKFDSIHLWGLQVESGSFPTSYIPTAGSTVTRSADAAELPSNTWYSDSGTLYADFNIAGPATGSYGNVVQLLENLGSRWGFPYTNGNNTLAALAYNAPDLTNSTLGGLSYGSNTRVVMTSPNGSQFVTSFNGASVVTTSATAVSNPTSLSIGKVLSDNNTFTGTFSKIAYYPQRLPNATLQAMTEE